MAAQPLTLEEVGLEIEVFTVAGGNDLPFVLGHLDKTAFNLALARLTPESDLPGYHAASINHRWVTFDRHQDDCDAEPVPDPEDIQDPHPIPTSTAGATKRSTCAQPTPLTPTQLP